MAVMERFGEPPPGIPALGSAAVHAWLVELEQPDAVVARLQDSLAEDELERAGRFHFERDRRRFTVARAALRGILAAYLDTAPDQLRFQYGPYGKPTLAAGCGDDRLRFNLSHSGTLALCAVTSGREIGVDIEWVRPLSHLEQIAQRFFSPRESAVLFALPSGEWLPAFYRCWTRKESYIKATGDGLQCPLDAFDVSLRPGDPPRLLRVAGQPDASTRWTLWDVSPCADYAAALLAEGQTDMPSRWRWRPG